MSETFCVNYNILHQLSFITNLKNIHTALSLFKPYSLKDYL